MLRGGSMDVQSNKKTVFPMREVKFDNRRHMMLQDNGAPAGIEEFGRSRGAARFSWQAYL